MVSINSTSEEVRRLNLCSLKDRQTIRFPLIQLPRKSEVYFSSDVKKEHQVVSINSTSEEVRSKSTLISPLSSVISFH